MGVFVSKLLDYIFSEFRQNPTRICMLGLDAAEILCANVDDIGSISDIFDAVGDHIFGCCNDASESSVTQACQELAEILISDSQKNTENKRVLDGPVHLESASSGRTVDFNESESIWVIRNEEQNLQVDPKKLEKAEARIKEKQDKRSNRPSAPFVKYENIDATASQAASKRESKQSSFGSAQSMDVRIENIDLAFGEKQLLKGGNLILAYGRRYGLIGRNGVGKTTLFRMISSGQLSIPSCITMLHVAQEVEGDDTTVLDSVLKSDILREKLIEDEKRIQKQLSSNCSADATDDLTLELNEIYKQLEACDADKAPGIAASILSGLGFSHEDTLRPTREFSGGWRMRLALARGLFIKCLKILKTTRNPTRPVIVGRTHEHVGHEGYFLVGKLLAGNYDNFEKAKEEKLKQQQREFEAQQQLRAHAQAFIDKFRYNAKRASLVQSKIKMLEKLPVLKPIDREHKVSFKFADAESLSPPIFQLDEVDFRYGIDEHLVFKSVCLGADMDSRVGENGVGKTTLLKLLMGHLEPTGGTRKAHRHLKIGYFTQHHVDQLVMDTSSLELAASRYPGLAVEAYRAALGKFGLSGDLALQSVSSLSGGQKSRLAFALINLSNPNFLILDEPTNHLDVETVEALGKSLCSFKGGVILVSHDERLIEIVCNELWVVRNRSVDKLDGGLKEYKNLVCKELGL